MERFDEQPKVQADKDQPTAATFEIQKLEERIAPSATVLHADVADVSAHAVLTPSGNVNAHVHL